MSFIFPVIEALEITVYYIPIHRILNTQILNTIYLTTEYVLSEYYLSEYRIPLTDSNLLVYTVIPSNFASTKRSFSAKKTFFLSTCFMKQTFLCFQAFPNKKVFSDLFSHKKTFFGTHSFALALFIHL